MREQNVIQLDKLGRLDMAPLWPPFPYEDSNDLRIICSDGQIHGSSLLLAAASPFLCHLLDNNEKEDQVLILPDIKLILVEALLCLVHSGITSVSLEDQAEDVIRLAKALELPTLTQDHNTDKPLEDQLLRSNEKPSKDKVNVVTRLAKAMHLPVLTNNHHNTEKPPDLSLCGIKKEDLTKMLLDNQTLIQDENEDMPEEIDLLKAEKNIVKKMFREIEEVAPVQAFETKVCAPKCSKPAQHSKLKRPPDYCEKPLKDIAKRKWGKKTKCHPCHYCEKAFFSKAQLQDHEKKHEGSPGYCCDSCGKAFYRKDCLTIHTKSVHFGERKFTCQTCGKKFINNYKLERHLQTHQVLTVAARKLQRKKAASVSLLKVELVDAYR